MEIKSIEDQGGAVSGYLATYLLPFLTELPQGWGDALAYAFYFATALAIYVQSDLAVVNPTLYLLGWRLHKVSLNGENTILISRLPVKVGDKVQVVHALSVHIDVRSYGTIEK
ncbi:hypothetical protein ACU635_08910 [[Actinomadura] parvosata]|uniref:hypothetical protein n=1 Tax=[Actinomadura] parvosata TaxID=1955412 RepID=UPI00406CD931